MAWALLAGPVSAEWRINLQKEAAETSTPLSADVPDATEFCDSGGENTRAYIDFATSNQVHQAYVRTASLQMERALIERGLLPPEPDQRRSVDFMFEVDRQGLVGQILVLAEPEEQALIQFVSALIAFAQPFPPNPDLVDACFASIVFTAAFDF